MQIREGELRSINPGRPAIFACLFGIWISCPIFPQSMMRGLGHGGAVQFIGPDAAILDSGEIRKDLPCTVTPVKPILGFDLRFHSGYEISLPLRQLAGDGNSLTVVFRVTSSVLKGPPRYFTER